MRGVKDTLIANGLATPESIVGCTERDFDELQASVQGKMPVAYVEFLRAVGRGAGVFLFGSEWCFPQLVEIRQLSHLALKNCGVQEPTEWLLPDRFPFASWGYSQFLFFDLNDGNDPRVFRYSIESCSPEVVFQSFSDWVRDCVEGEVSQWLELSDSARVEYADTVQCPIDWGKAGY